MDILYTVRISIELTLLTLSAFCGRGKHRTWYRSARCPMLLQIMVCARVLKLELTVTV
jgi:hypothetical protein